MWKNILSFCLCLVVAGLPVAAGADGMLVAPPQQWIEESGQQAAILYENGTETLVLSTTFQGDAEDFGWIVPVPSEPEISRGSRELFTNLQKVTKVTPQYNKRNSLFELDGSAPTEQAVSVLSVTNIDYYEVTTLTAEKSEDLATWFNDNGYEFPAAASYVLNSYIENDWYFVAMRINPENLAWEGVGQELRTGQATPVVLKFQTKNIVYPLKISSITAGQQANEPTWTSGKIGQAIQLDTRDISLEYNDQITVPVTGNFNPTSGTVSAWIKPGWSSYDQRVGNIRLLHVADDDMDGSMVLEYSIEYDARTSDYSFWLSTITDMQRQSWQSEPISLATNTWQHTAVSWEAGKQPTFFFNGAPLTVVKAEDGTNYKALLNEVVYRPFNLTNGTATFGYMATSYTVYDELLLATQTLPAATVQAYYLDGQRSVEIAVDPAMSVLAHFNRSLKNEVSGTDLTFTPGKKNATQQSRVPITLYVMSDRRVTAPNFSTTFANTIDKTSIRELAVNDVGDPLLQPANKKYFLTALTRQVAPVDMTEDVFIRAATTNDTIGQPIRRERPASDTTFYVALAVSLVLSVGFGIGLLRLTRQPTHSKKS